MASTQLSHLQDVQTNIARRVDIGVETWCRKSNSWRRKRIVCRKLDVQFIHQTFIDCATAAFNCPKPFKQVVTHWKSSCCGVTRHLLSNPCNHCKRVLEQRSQPTINCINSFCRRFATAAPSEAPEEAALAFPRGSIDVADALFIFAKKKLRGYKRVTKDD